jgi:hypothetical protein
VNDSPRILHSSAAEEKKLGFPFSENGPSDIQGEAATAPFSDLGEWSESAVTTPNDEQLRNAHSATLALSGFPNSSGSAAPCSDSEFPA